MLSFDQLVYETQDLENEERENYLINFFTANNFDDYLIDESCSEDERMDIYEMFHSSEDILIRALMILDRSPLCMEANYVNYLLNEETMVDLWFNTLMHKSPEFGSFSEYGKASYLRLLNIYAQFLMDIHNVTFAIKVVKRIADLEKGYSDDSIAKLAYMYSIIEKDDEFYELYHNEDFNDMIPYLLLMVVLLKHEDELKAREVLSDFIDKFKYGDYIDRIWELDSNDSAEAVELRSAIDVCFEEICSVPYFFSWCFDNKEKKLRS